MAGQSLNEMELRLTAGREYLTAVRKLGFDPDAAFWAGAGSAEPMRMELCLVTTWADNVGSKPVYDLLFEAYDSCATPKEINPFIVSLFSPQSTVAVDLYNAIRSIRSEGNDHNPSGAMIILGMMDYVTAYPWILAFRPSRSTRFDDARRFRAFQTNVERLAA